MEQGIFYLADLIILDVPALFAKVRIAGTVVPDPVKAKELAFTQAKVQLLKTQMVKDSDAGNSSDVVVTLKNKGGAIMSWQIPVSTRCSRVSLHMLQITNLAVEELRNRGMLPKDSDGADTTSEDILKSVRARWLQHGSVLLTSTVGQRLCTRGGAFTLRVDMIGDVGLQPSLVNWMNGLLKYEQRQGLVDGLIEQKIVRLSSMARVDIERLEAAVFWAFASCTKVFKAALSDGIRKAKIEQILATGAARGSYATGAADGAGVVTAPIALATSPGDTVSALAAASHSTEI